MKRLYEEEVEKNKTKSNTTNEDDFIDYDNSYDNSLLEDDEIEVEVCNDTE